MEAKSVDQQTTTMAQPWTVEKQFCIEQHILKISPFVLQDQCDQIGRFIWLWASF